MQLIEKVVSHPRFDSSDTYREELRLAQIELAQRAVENSKSDWSKRFWTNVQTILVRRAL